MLVISPFAKKNYISHVQMDDVSILRFIQKHVWAVAFKCEKPIGQRHQRHVPILIDSVWNFMIRKVRGLRQYLRGPELLCWIGSITNRVIYVEGVSSAIPR